LGLDVFGRLSGLFDEIIDFLFIFGKEWLEVIQNWLGHVCLSSSYGQLVAGLFKSRGDYVLRGLDVHARWGRKRPFQIAADDFDDRALNLARDRLLLGLYVFQDFVHIVAPHDVKVFVSLFEFLAQVLFDPVNMPLDVVVDLDFDIIFDVVDFKLTHA